MNPQDFAQILSFVANEHPENCDAIVYIEGDGDSDPQAVAELYHSGFAPKILVTGEIKRSPSEKDSRTQKVYQKMISHKVPDANLIIEKNSISTREQAVEILKLAQELGWGSIILSAPLYHQPRAYATFVKAMKENKLKVKIINQPVKALSWFESTPHGLRISLLKKEFNKINKYWSKGHVANIKEVVAYQKWKEKN